MYAWTRQSSLLGDYASAEELPDPEFQAICP